MYHTLTLANREHFGNVEPKIIGFEGTITSIGVKNNCCTKSPISHRFNCQSIPTFKRPLIVALLPTLLAVAKPKVHPTRDDRGCLALTFEHPTMPGPQPGGWMVKSESSLMAAAPLTKVFVTYHIEYGTAALMFLIVISFNVIFHPNKHHLLIFPSFMCMYNSV